MTDQQWKEAFEKELWSEGFTWADYYRDSQYKEFKKLLHEHNAVFTGVFTRAEGKCIKCTARMSIEDLGILIPNDHGGQNTITLIKDYRDHSC